MKKIMWIVALTIFTGLGVRSMAAATADPSLDVITLKDGRVVSGQIVEESGEKVVFLVDGVKRSYNRNFVTKISYGTGPTEGMQASSAGPSEGAPVGEGPEVKGSLTAQIAATYDVPEKAVIWVRKQGIVDADLPLVFYVAAKARVQTRVVVRLRLERWSWNEIEAHFGLRRSGIYVEPEAVVVDPYPYYPGYWGWGGGGWGWGGRFHGHWR